MPIYRITLETGNRQTGVKVIRIVHTFQNIKYGKHSQVRHDERRTQFDFELGQEYLAEFGAFVQKKGGFHYSLGLSPVYPDVASFYAKKQ